jgi:hypothetical protein
MLLSQPDKAQANAAQQDSAQVIAPRFHLFFDPKVVEGMWEHNYPGGMIGYTSCLTAGIARWLMLSSQEGQPKPNFEQGIQRGLAAMRALHQEGYGGRGTTVANAQLRFPLELVAAELAKEETPFAVAEVRSPVRFLGQPLALASRAVASRTAKGTRAGVDTTETPDFWTILQDRYRGDLDGVAQQIVLYGVGVALQGVPLGEFGNLLTVDRQEIESFRSIRALVGNYLRQDNQKRPLSIAVFGSPGSGKSFGVEEVAKSLPGQQIKKLDFNLSQFGGPEQLLDAFHQVRDVVLSSQIPLVFWDEFDTALDREHLGWLRHFLAPMQDGSFQEGQITHPIGRSIFVFAGGTSHSMEAFNRFDENSFRLAKGPDFVSRLKGYVNIMGPNPQGDASTDPYFIIRRAILLRSILQRHAHRLFQEGDGAQVVSIDSGVLRAFLQIPDYKHGARSMEALVAMSTLAGQRHFERSCLPAEAQLNLHVDGRRFLSLMHQMELDGVLLERLAEAHHEVFRAGLPEGSAATYAKTPYADLPEDIREENRAAVRDIFNKLSKVGYVMISARNGERVARFPDDTVEILAEMEHDRWMKSKIAAGWRYGENLGRDRQDPIGKLHEDLLPWLELSEEERAGLYTPAEAAAIGTKVLPEEEKDKDRALARGIPDILARAGYVIAKIGDGGSSKDPR